MNTFTSIAVIASLATVSASTLRGLSSGITTEVHAFEGSAMYKLAEKENAQALGNFSSGVQPIPIAPKDAATCGITDPYPCEAPGWVYCINAVCESEPTVDPLLYGGKPFNKCSCWQPSNTDLSILPLSNDGGANCVLGSGPSGKEMCAAMKGGALISTYGPDGTFRDQETKDGPTKFSLQSAMCKPHTPWAWCWGAPCVKDPESPTGITCHCPYMTSTNEENQPISLAGSDQCTTGNPCDSIHNSMPAGTSPNQNKPCYNETGIL